MRGKILAAVAVLVLAVASVALAGPPEGKGKPEGAKGKPAKTGVGCKPAVSVVLKGTLASVPGAGTSFTMNVTSGNAFGRAYVAAAQPVTIQTTASTKVRRQGAKEASALVVGDWALVQARACKADLANGAVAPLTALRITAKPAKATTTTTTTASTQAD
jgi:hypothetical protein